MDRLDHTAITVSNIDQAVSWYEGSFDCKVLYKTETEAMLEFENVKLQLLLPSQRPSHLAFRKNDADTYGNLKKNKDGSRSCFISDSTGNLVEVIAFEDED